MNRIDRISAILVQLQSKKVVKGQEIADRFNISLRTAYRDIKTLEEAGVPIISEAGIGYSLADGYRLPPVMFTKQEATAFLTAEKLVEKLTDQSTHEIYQSALYKIKAVLRADDKNHLDNMEEYIAVVDNPYLPKDTQSTNHMQVILNSIAQKKVLSIDYFAQHNQTHSSRKIEPIGIFMQFNHWYLIGYCWLRKDYRNFRIERIVKAQQTQIDFAKTHPPLKNYLKEMSNKENKLITAVLRFDKKALHLLGDQKYYCGFVSEKEVDGKIEMTFLNNSIEGLARWYMMLADKAEIVSPKALKTRVQQLAENILKKI
jgi:predicted DNA-binding transcriptional regulator YafY